MQINDTQTLPPPQHINRSLHAGDGLSPDKIAPKGYLPFFEAREFAKLLNLRTRKEWRNYVRGSFPDKPTKPDNIPAHPDGIYKVKGWQGWKYWLGTADVGLN